MAFRTGLLGKKIGMTQIFTATGDREAVTAIHAGPCLVIEKRTPEKHGYAAVKPRPDESADKWHTFEIHCIGPKIKVISDGVTVVDVDQTKLTAPDEKGYTDPKTKPLHGYIGLQDSHSPAGHYVEYRNIRIKELKPAPGSK